MEQEALLSLCMIVKDEEEMLSRCLNSVQGVVEEIIVVDTGSTDRTVEIAKSMGAKVYNYRWDHDFSRARNVSLEKARGKWILFLDADEEIHPDDRGFVRTLLTNTEASGFFMVIENKMDHETERALALRLFRSDPQHYFVGSFHEQIASSILSANPHAQFHRSGLRIVHHGYTSEVMKKKKKEERNLEMALAEVSRRPYDGYLRYCAAQAYLGRANPDRQSLEEAVKHLLISKEKSHPDAMWTPRIYKLLMIGLDGLGKKEEAYSILLEGITKYPHYQDLYYLQGKWLEREGKWDRAIGAYQQCLQIEKETNTFAVHQEIENSQLHFALARVYEQKGNHVKAIEEYMNTIVANRQWKEPYVRIGSLMLKTVAVEKVQKLFEQWIPPDSTENLLFLKDVFSQLGETQSVLAYLDRILALEPARIDLLFLSAGYFMQLSNYEEAVNRLQKIPRDSALYRESRLMLASAYWFLGEQDKAKKVLRIDGDASLYRELAEVFLQEAAYTLEEGTQKSHDQKLIGQLAKIREVMKFGKE
ncbi:glycosyltransferase [Effusibacillus consociatus]|uniref:Glycosyltransferase n=1 Tax=Effusibacillus consociatus TaxID=1117041 RepID=A0ABV9Q0I4_9BACL